MDSMPRDKDTVTLASGKVVSWWQNPVVHFYIIRSQHTYTACRHLVNNPTLSAASRNELLKFEVVPVFSQDKLILIRVSNALNLNLAEKVAKEDFQSCIELGRAAWGAVGFPEPHRGCGKPSPAFEVLLHFPFAGCLVITLHVLVRVSATGQYIFSNMYGLIANRICYGIG